MTWRRFASWLSALCDLLLCCDRPAVIRLFKVCDTQLRSILSASVFLHTCFLHVCVLLCFCISWDGLLQCPVFICFFFVCLVLQFRSTLTVLYLFLRLLLAIVFFYLVNFMLFRVPEWSFGAIREPTSVLRSLFASFLLSLFSFGLLGLLCFFFFHLHFTFPLPSSCRALIPEIKQWQEQWN